MKENYFNSYLDSFTRSLSSLETTLLNGELIDLDQWLPSIESLTSDVQQRGGRFFFAGNGASAAFASHMSLDWSKNGGIPCLPLLDLSHLTALGNDLGYEEVFSTAIDWHGHENDLLITISSSGNSPNIIRAIESARKKGMKVVTLSGLKADNQSRKLGDLNLYISAKTYGIVECAHQVVLHAWLDHWMKIKEWDREETQNMRANDFQL